MCLTGDALMALVTLNRFEPPVLRESVARDWAERGYSGENFTAPPGREWNDFMHRSNELVTVVEVVLTAPPAAVAPGACLHKGLINELGAPFAALMGCRCGKRRWMEKFGDWHHTEIIQGWTNGSEARWDFTALQSNRFHVYAYYECWAEAEGSELEIAVAGQCWTFPALYTGGGKGLRTRLRHMRLGLVNIPDGQAQLTLCGLDIKGDNALLLQKIVLAPTG